MQIISLPLNYLRCFHYFLLNSQMSHFVLKSDALNIKCLICAKLCLMVLFHVIVQITT